MSKTLRLAVLISGGGTTLRNLLEYSDRNDIDVDFQLVISSNSRAGGLAIAENAGIPTSVVRRRDADHLNLEFRDRDLPLDRHQCRSARHN